LGYIAEMNALIRDARYSNYLQNNTGAGKAANKKPMTGKPRADILTNP